MGLGLGFITIDTGDGNAVDVELQQHPSGLDGVYQLVFSPENTYALGGTTWKIQWTNADPSNAIQTTFVVDTADTIRVRRQTRPSADRGDAGSGGGRCVGSERSATQWWPWLPQLNWGLPWPWPLS